MHHYFGWHIDDTIRQSADGILYQFIQGMAPSWVSNALYIEYIEAENTYVESDRFAGIKRSGTINLRSFQT